MSDKARVVVTGMGVATCLGFDLDIFWNNVRERRTGIRTLRSYNLASNRESVGGEIDDAALAEAFKGARIRPVDRAVDMGVLAAGKALLHAGIIADTQPAAPTDMTTIFACHGSWRSVYEIAALYFSKGAEAVRPSSLPRFIPSAAPSQISMRYKLTGANYVVMSACSSSSTAIGIAFRTIREGYTDAVLCGGADSQFDPFVFGGWSKLGVMSQNPDPLRACRPFDAGRDGCVLGEGGAALVLESEARAKARGARIYAEIIGYGESSDASHITRPEPEGQARAIRAALSSAGVTPDEIGIISAHGTATRSNDVSEAQAVGMAMGEAGTRIPVVSHKSYVGHMLGASGAIETIIAILGVRDGAVPSNLNLDRIDPECRVNAPCGEPVRPATPVILKNSFGFGGNNSVLVVRAAVG